MVALFVSPSVTLKDVSRPAKGETPAQRLYRLAVKGVIEGCRVMREFGSGEFLITSSRDSATVYRVDRDALQCSCDGHTRFGVCKHRALVLAELGELPDPNDDGTEPPTGGSPVALLPESPVTVTIVCGSCLGTGEDAIRVPGSDDWHPILCPVCHGRGVGDYALTPSTLATVTTVSRDTIVGDQCPTCRGAGVRYVSTGGRGSDWITPPCDGCQGTGMVPHPDTTATVPAVADLAA